MVSKKRLYYGGLNGFQSAVVPKAPRSLRRNTRKKPSPGSEICAFDLLATVAGELLQESESSVSSTGPETKEQVSIPIEGVKQEPLEVKLSPSRLDYLDQGSCGESEFVPEPPVKNLPQSVSDSGLDHASDFLKKVSTNVKSEASNGENGTSGDLCDVQMDTNNRTKVQIDVVDNQSEDLTAVKSCVNQHVSNNSYNSVHLPFYSDNVPSACTPRPGNNVKISIRDDDDENPCSFNHHYTKMRAFRLQSRAGYRRIRKMLTATKHWKSAPKLKDHEPVKTTSLVFNPFYHNRKNRYIRDCCQGETASKRRKLFHHSSKPDHVQETSSESISNLPKAKAVTSSVTNHKSSFHSKDGQMKFSIKSFNIPELYVEMPETSTIGSLKATVMEAVTAILGGELHVGVLLQGKKIKDDSITLQQTGISLDSDTLGFMLEPSFRQECHEEPPLLPPSDNHELLASSPVCPVMNLGSLNSSLDSSLATSLENQNNQESKEVPTEEIVDTKAITPVTPLNPQALSIVPASHSGSKRSELSQRRMRRPFSVSEVEALVEAVETLGTGRWRDVKIRAFDDANHRTYVDLKDKWKTLVHTASISPQQRRGEPVPQGLLDRVLAAHSMWSQHSSKPHGFIKPPHTGPIQSPPVQVCLEF